KITPKMMWLASKKGWAVYYLKSEAIVHLIGLIICSVAVVSSFSPQFFRSSHSQFFKVSETSIHCNSQSRSTIHCILRFSLHSNIHRSHSCYVPLWHWCNCISCLRVNSLLPWTGEFDSCHSFQLQFPSCNN
ncbi:hypothetical protein PFISCL1PPCAC_14765, partial [Pristionchus fissidentatus]